MNKLYLIIGVVVLVLVAGFMMMQNQTATTITPNTNAEPTSVVEEVGPTEEVMEKNVVNYSDSGFSPQSLTVKVGTPVTFINQSAGQMWVASAPHPQHTDYPEFDELKSVEKDGEYTFTFDKVGTWKYHNHKNASDFGSVTVTE
ncbi:hypothetical protein A2773_05585 [Candidatus Gottesmanbacteria bacterium RIFCSPHIGHO2_01_FULL_39_10]|uniref:EfeO-type cupredoxin-like domain-containing protein n=1 Tax=Candidatus Gottesmanbacteria bacterium RIFCSPHIGHO2_01_FULL_39_10 TaxID=1798375 RepID=A0A1F5ZQ47_9BACT|nr:MAG: hypothetical protein A2773_05585 [Candidatus Gottesmanbacteria bacterium RIFCSPHIGHO2_01_FULL_39_10]